MPSTPVNAVAISSVIPSAKKSCAASPELFARGSTATMGRPDAGAWAKAGERIAPSASADTAASFRQLRLRSTKILPMRSFLVGAVGWVERQRNPSRADPCGSALGGFRWRSTHPTMLRPASRHHVNIDADGPQAAAGGPPSRLLHLHLAAVAADIPFKASFCIPFPVFAM